MIAIVSYNKLLNLTESDKILKMELEKEGYDTSIVSWDADIDWSQFDSIIIRSCWDYHYRIGEFLTWIESLETKHIKVWNPVSVIKNNYKKTYLRQLEAKGISTIKTEFISRNSTIDVQKFCSDHGWQEIIIKPSIGASAFEIYKIDKDDINAQKTINQQLEKSDILIQPFMREIAKGEISMVFINKIFSHAVLKVPDKNEFRSNHEFNATEKLIHPDQSIVRQATAILNLISEELLYARVDGIIVDSNFLLMELELIEPDLFFNLYPKGATALARAFKEK